MLDTRYDSVVYQSQVYVSALVDQLIVAKKKIGKEKDAQWAKVDRIYAYLEALQETPKLTDETDITNITFILECLIVLCEIASFPVVPSLMWTGVPNLIVGIAGPPGQSIKGDTGATGFATDFMAANLTAPAVVDFFPIANAKGARWDYVAVDSITGAQRASSIIGQWTPDGILLALTDLGTDDLVGSTTALEFDLVSSSSYVQLIAVVTSGQWTINGTRYYIPSNGNGSGPVSAVLPQGTILIGNSSNLAQSQTVSGAISITDSGVTSLNAGVVTNSNIAVGAGVAVNKLAALTPNQIVLTDSLGFLTTIVAPSLTQLSYLDATSSIQTQLNSKMTDPTTSIGDIIIRNGSNVLTRLPAGTPGQVLTLSGSVPSWQNAAAGFADPMTSVGDLIIRNGGNVTARLPIGTTDQILVVSGGVASWQNNTESGVNTKTKIISIGSWNMFATLGGSSTKNVAHGLSDTRKIRSVNVTIVSDGNVSNSLFRGTDATNSAPWGFETRDNTNIILTRTNTGGFNNSNYISNSTRGYVTIVYEV